MKPKTRLLLALTLIPLNSLSGCSTEPRAIPGGATEAAVFFTPQVRTARATAGHTFPSQHAEYARRDAHMGISASNTARANLYPPRRGTQSFTRIEQTRVVATDHGYRITERSQVSQRTSTSHRHR